MGQTKTKARAGGVTVAYARIAWIVLAFAVLVSGTVLLSATGRATARVTLALEEREEPITVRVGQAVPGSSPIGEAVAVPGELVESVGTGKAQKEIRATRVIAGRARGVVTLVNTTSRARALVATTRLLPSSGVLFRIVKAVVVPARASIRVEAAADAIGQSGDVGPGRWTIPGLSRSLQPLIYGQTTESMSGGATEARRVDKVDIAEVVAKAEVEAAAQAERSMTVASDLFRFSRSTSSLRELNAKEGGNVPVLTASVRTVVTHVLLDPKVANAVLTKAMEAREGFTGKDVVEVRSDISSFELGKIYRSEGVAELSGRATVVVRRKTDGLREQFQPMLAGLAYEEALSKLRTSEGVAAASIQLSPPWLWALPKRADRITVLLK